MVRIRRFEFFFLPAGKTLTATKFFIYSIGHLHKSGESIIPIITGFLLRKFPVIKHLQQNKNAKAPYHHPAEFSFTECL